MATIKFLNFRLFMKIFLFFVFAVLAVQAIAQDTTWKKPVDSSSVIIHKDARLDLLMNKQAEINEITSREARRTMKGFRLMIITTSSRDEAIAAKTKVYTFFPELKAYLWHQSPYFKLKAGNFKEKKEAEAYRKKLNLYFPRGVFILQDIIEIKPEKEKDTERL